MTIRAKILLPMILLTILAAAAILVANIVQFSAYVDKSTKESVDMASTVAEKEFELLKSESETASMYVAEDAVFADALERKDRDALLKRVQQLQQDISMDFCTITDINGNVVARSHEPDNYGDNVSSQANVRAAMSGDVLTAIEQGTAVRLSIRSGAPVYNMQNQLIGVVSTGFRLDTEAFVDSIKGIMGCEVTVFLQDERIATTVVKEDGSRAIGTKAAENVSQTVLAGNVYTGTAKILNNDALTKYTPFYGPDGKVLGMLFVGRYTTEATKTIWSFVRTGALIILLLMAAATPVILYIVKNIVAPIKTMVKTADALADGDSDISVQVKTRDEMKDLAGAFNKMIENTHRQVQAVTAIANGDLTVSIATRSDRDLMNQALETMLAMNNDVFRQIVGSANQVAAGAQLMASSSQTLSQGVAEQTATVEQLTANIETVTVKTQESTTMAEQAAALTISIKADAQKGSEQMNRMVQAVKEIDEASHMINKIIKVIDDIAFQTNILALNAAVEAARAGQHGKGFAVVAEEVRSLAAKSADAAKDTGSLIENSIAKAQLGVHIADETADSLQQIVQGINESSKIVHEISTSTTQQNAAILQISDGIQQVTQVVQQNSAAAQESAAVSQEMNSQATLLQNMVSRFRLSAADNGNAQLPQHPRY